MKRATVMLIILCLTLTSCSKNSADIPTEETISETTAGAATANTEPTAAPTAEATPLPSSSNILGDNVSEINLSALLNLGERDQASFSAPIDDRHIVMLHYKFGGSNQGWEGCYYSVIDIAETKIMYTERLNGFPSSSFQTDSDCVYLISRIRTSPGVPIEDYYITYFYPDESTIEKYETSPPIIMRGKQERVLIHSEGGIFEQKDDGLDELLPPVPDEQREWGEYGEWYMTMDAISYKFTAQIDENRFVYTKSGYESIPGFGIYDFAQSEYFPVPDSMDLRVFGIVDSTIYTSHREWDWFTIHGIYTTDVDTLKTELLLDTREFVKNECGLREEDLSSTHISDPFFSPDKECIVFMACADDGAFEYDCTIYLIDPADGSLLEKYSFASPSISPQYLHFVGNRKIIVTGEKIYQQDQYAFLISPQI